jgi:hypothetical protein
MMIFLDDIRSPQECASYMDKRIGKLNPIYTKGGWYIVRNYEEFQDSIIKYIADITHISFDHDLADGHYHDTMYSSSQEYTKHLETIKEKTGYECAKWLKEYYIYKEKELPIMFVHSMNPVGTENIVNLFKSK